MTAVEWFKNELESYGSPSYCEIAWEDLDMLFEQAKEMEEKIIAEQSVEAYHKGYEEAESYYRWPVSKQLETDNQ